MAHPIPRRFRAGVRGVAGASDRYSCLARVEPVEGRRKAEWSRQADGLTQRHDGIKGDPCCPYVLRRRPERWRFSATALRAAHAVACDPACAGA